MLSKVLKSKIYPLKVTQKNLHYEEGSIGLSKKLLREASISAYELVLVINMCNGERFETYVIPIEKDGVCVLYGGAARKGEIGDKLLVFSFLYISPEEKVTPKIVKVDESNILLKN